MSDPEYRRWLLEAIKAGDLGEELRAQELRGELDLDAIEKHLTALSWQRTDPTSHGMQRAGSLLPESMRTKPKPEVARKG